MLSRKTPDSIEQYISFMLRPYIFLCKNLLSILVHLKPLFMLYKRHCYSKLALIPFTSNTSLFYFSRYRIMKSDVSTQREAKYRQRKKKHAEEYSDISRAIIMYIFPPGSLRRTMKDSRRIRGSFWILANFSAFSFFSRLSPTEINKYGSCEICPGSRSYQIVRRLLFGRRTEIKSRCRSHISYRLRIPCALLKHYSPE